jgi:hypothetical protein
MTRRIEFFGGTGDGVVDVEDLKVFIAEWEKKNAVVQP